MNGDVTVNWNVPRASKNDRIGNNIRTVIVIVSDTMRLGGMSAVTAKNCPIQFCPRDQTLLLDLV